MSNVPDSNVTLDIPTTMLLNMNGAEGDVECKIVAPSGREDDCFITPLGEGEHQIFNETYFSCINPNWHELLNQEKCSSLGPPRSTFFKIKQ